MVEIVVSIFVGIDSPITIAIDFMITGTEVDLMLDTLPNFHTFLLLRIIVTKLNKTFGVH